MKLKDYTAFTALIRKYTELIRLVEILRLAEERLGEEADLENHLQYLLNNWFLYAKLGFEKFKEMTDLFHKRIGFDPEAELRKGRTIIIGFTADQVVNNEEVFFITLAEFCEPLIGKATEAKT